MTTIGLRERKKAQTREALSRAALKLTEERGLEAINGDAIAEAADVSPRTFRNYFASKEDAVLYSVGMVDDRLVDSLRSRPPDEPILDALEVAMCGVIEQQETFATLSIVFRLMTVHPRLRAHWVAFKPGHDDEALLVEIARRTHTDPARQTFPRVVRHGALGVLAAALEMQGGHAPTRKELLARIRSGFAELRAALTAPS